MSREIYITQPIPKEAREILEQKGYRVFQNPEDRVLSKDEMLREVQERDGVICLLSDKIDAQVLERAGRSKIFANYAVGYDNLDVPCATRLGICVSNTPGVLTITTAELTWALILAVTRRIVPAERHLKEGKFTHWGPLLMLGTDLFGKTLGILGCGRIGMAVARMSVGFQMRILYANRNPNAQVERETSASRVDLETLLKESDVLTVHLPLSPETRHLIGKRELSLMKKTAFLINTSRGPIVDEEALACALSHGDLAGAGLDVYEREPLVHPQLLSLQNATLLPHIGSASLETRTRMAVMAAENVAAALEGKPIPNLVNAEVLENPVCRTAPRQERSLQE